jgi:SAM-dependent methyltransferase
MRRLLAEIPLAGARVLEVGCGEGHMTLWLAFHGPRHVTALDPGGAGSTMGSTTKFRGALARLRPANVTFHEWGLGEHPLPEAGFDIVLCFDAINHLYETRADLNSSPVDRARYVGIFREFHRLLAPGGVAIVTDVSRRNLLRTLPGGHPVPGWWAIDWDLHQTPQTWIGVMREAGFRRFRLGWYVPYRLRAIPWLADNAAFNYLTFSHFTIWAFPR